MASDHLQVATAKITSWTSCKKWLQKRSKEQPDILAVQEHNMQQLDQLAVARAFARRLGFKSFRGPAVAGPKRNGHNSHEPAERTELQHRRGASPRVACAIKALGEAEFLSALSVHIQGEV